ncbi:MAG TPA: gamma-glutamyl-gamma-aminobutyrate hydrolase family protein [Bryobacteraceae bacterium]|jgi:gamma-glutamyl-gamma-aminobutyrate hydrolase PuuD
MPGHKRVLIPFRHAKKLEPYQEAVRLGGMEPVAVSVSDSTSLDGVKGLVLMGGTDVNPRRYAATPHLETDEPDDERDEVELKLIAEALERDLPVLAICRGLQILNVQHGGTLIQHLASPRHDPEPEDKSAPVHRVRFEPGSLLREVTGVEEWDVNSRHHQSADRIGNGLRVSARDEQDGIVEGLERPDKRFVLAVQWHPEDQVKAHREQLRLFECFAEALD